MGKTEYHEIANISGVRIYSIATFNPDGTKTLPDVILYKAGMTIDGDGGPHCYNPDDTGLDFLANGGYPDDGCYGMVTDPDDSESPEDCILQQMYHPAPGYFVSATSLTNPVFPTTSPDRYINSEEIPFIAVPGGHDDPSVPGWDSFKVKLGDVAFVWNMADDNNCFAVVADVGPSSHAGEGSIKLATALGLNGSPKYGGTEKTSIVYLLFPGSVGKWTAPDYWFPLTNTLLKEWGGWSRLKALVAELYG
jgi:Fungal chitosanase of glycosyl hydrolase group 75